MAVQTITAEAIGQRYARELSNVVGVRELWVYRNRNWFDVWLLTDPVDDDMERLLYGASAVLYQDFPGIYFRMHVLNPANYEIVPDLKAEIPNDAVGISLATVSPSLPLEVC